jgi:hypothetical protein
MYWNFTQYHINMYSYYVSIKSNHKWAGGVAQVAECLPSKCEAFSSNSSTAKKPKQNINPSTRENHEFEASLGYIARPSLKKNKNLNKKW